MLCAQPADKQMVYRQNEDSARCRLCILQAVLYYFQPADLIPRIALPVRLQVKSIFAWPWPWVLVKIAMCLAAFILYYGGYHAEAGLIIRQMREQGLTTRLLSGDALVTQEFWNITGKLGEGTLMTFSPDPRKNPKVAPLIAKFKEQGSNAEGYTLYTYGAIQVFVEAVRRVGAVDTAKILAEMRKGKFDTVLDSVGFDAKGDVTAPGYVFYEWKDGNYDYTKL